MKITCAKILPVKDDEKLKAFVTIVIDDCLVIKDLKVIKGANDFFIAMPAKQTKDGRYVDIAHPLNKETRQELEKTILDEYERVTKQPPSVHKRTQNSL